MSIKILRVHLFTTAAKNTIQKRLFLHGFHPISTFHLAAWPAYQYFVSKCDAYTCSSTANLIPRVSPLKVLPLLCWLGLSRNVYHNTDNYLSQVYSLQLNCHMVRICRQTID